MTEDEIREYNDKLDLSAYRSGRNCGTCVYQGINVDPYPCKLDTDDGSACFAYDHWEDIHLEFDKLQKLLKKGDNEIP